MAKVKTKLSQHYPIGLLGLLLLITVTLTTRYFDFAMMGLTVFVFAYLSKGMRKR